MNFFSFLVKICSGIVTLISYTLVRVFLWIYSYLKLFLFSLLGTIFVAGKKSQNRYTSFVGHVCCVNYFRLSLPWCSKKAKCIFWIEISVKNCLISWPVERTSETWVQFLVESHQRLQNWFLLVYELVGSPTTDRDKLTANQKTSIG